MSEPFTHVGKQVLANGHHYADAADEQAARFIAAACNLQAQLGRTCPSTRTSEVTA